MKQAASPEFQMYAHQVVENSKTIAEHLKSLGHTIVTNGTDNHLILWDLRPHQITGSKMERLCELARYGAIL